MMIGMSEEIESLIWRLGLENAINFNGKTNIKVILGKILQNHPDLRSKAKELSNKVNIIVEKINSMNFEAQKKKFSEDFANFLEDKQKIKTIEEKTLPPLPNVKKGHAVVMRLAPYPSGPLHIGNARMVLLNDEYCNKMYQGKLLLVYDDTIGSDQKWVLPEAYDLIKENLDFLGIKIHKSYYKTDRMDIYQDHCKKLLEKGKAYVCTCDGETWRDEYKIKKKGCPCRSMAVEENLARWEKMLDGTFPEKSAGVRLKTGMDLADPALRDHIIMRISERDHPRVGQKYRVWPLLEFSWGIDDYLLGITHIIRGKDLMKEDRVEELIWKMFGWKKNTEFIHYGIISFQDMKLSKTYNREQIQSGNYIGWEDPRTWSINSLKSRGIRAEAIRDTILDFGLSLTDIKFSPQILYSFNKKYIDPISERYFFVDNPREIEVSEIPYENLKAEALKLPNNPEKGYREFDLKIENGKIQLYIALSDVKKLKKEKKLRLKDLFNIEITEIDKKIKAIFSSKELDIARDKKYSILHWVPYQDNIECSVLKPDGTTIKGVGETNLLNVIIGNTIQFERFGFVRLIEKKPIIKTYFSHK
ncbi:MAG: glutamate--tRNA ligase [Candidatus Lokiarchaeota archaeon]|nr:glutamate--tRNA ligase [Candidatus Lokiarchaeota archaeon]